MKRSEVQERKTVSPGQEDVTTTNKATEDYIIRSNMSGSESEAVSSEHDEDSDDFDSMESDEGEVGSLTGGSLSRWMLDASA